MKRALIATGLLLLASVAVAQKELSPLLSTMNADNATFYPRYTYPSGAFGPMGVIYTTSATAATGTGTGEQVLATYDLPANGLDAAGRRLRIHAFFHAATNGNNKTMIVYFGNVAVTTGVLTTSNGNIVIDMDVVKSGSSTQIVTSSTNVIGTLSAPAVAAGSVTDTAAITIKATGTDGTSSAGDIVLEDFYVRYQS